MKSRPIDRILSAALTNTTPLRDDPDPIDDRHILAIGAAVRFAIKTVNENAEARAWFIANFQTSSKRPDQIVVWLNELIEGGPKSAWAGAPRITQHLVDAGHPIVDDTEFSRSNQEALMAVLLSTGGAK